MERPVGFDFLGLKSPRWDVAAMLRSMSSLPGRVPCGAFLDETFGNHDEHIVQLLQSGKVSIFRGHLRWSDHKPVPLTELIARAQKFNALAQQFPDIAFYCSAICEHSMTAQQSAAINAGIRPSLPNIKGIVDSGMKGVDPSAIHETHGDSANSAAISYDGQSSVDEDIESFKKRGTLYCLLWDLWDNGKYSNKDTTPAAQRRYFPTQDQFNLKIRSSYPMPIWPPGVPHIVAPEIWKPSSEGYPVDRTGKHGAREFKPVAILNRGFSAVRILAMNGKPIGHMTYGGTFGRGQHRYYLGNGSGQTAFELGQQAESAAQSEFVFLDAPGYRVVVNAYRRGGKFH